MLPPDEAATSQVRSKPPMLQHHMVRRVLALGHALGLEPLHVPLRVEAPPESPAEPAAAPATDPDPKD